MLGKELFSWLFAYAVLPYTVLTVCVPFPFWCLGQDVEIDFIGS